MRVFFRVILCLVWVAVLAGCRSVSTVPPVVHYRDSIQIQKEYIHDSIYNDRWHTIYIKGDTIREKDSIVIYTWRIREVHDTLRVNHADTVPVPVERELTGGERFMIRSDGRCGSCWLCCSWRVWWWWLLN